MKLVVLLLAVLPVAGAEWRAGLAREDITPAKPIRMAGYAARTSLSEGVSTRLWAKALALADGHGNRAVLITADTLGIPAVMSGRICARIGDRRGLPRSAILLNGSHTHAGPLLMVRFGYAVSDEERAVIEEYEQMFEDRLVRAALNALDHLQPARLSWSNGVAGFVMNRREFTAKGVILGVNPRGPVDRSVPVLKVESEAGGMLAVVFGAACHNTTLTGGNLLIDGDYAGHAQLDLERRFPGVQAMFLIGCGGDANPYPRRTLELAKRHGRSLAAEVARLLETELEPVRGPIRTELRIVDLPLRQLTRAQIEQRVGLEAGAHRFFIKEALARLDAGGKLPRSYPAPFALWQFGNDLTLVAYSGETVVDYVRFTERALGPLGLWVVGYANDVFGYLPSTRLLREGGYETRGLYTEIGLFEPGVEKPILAAIRDMAVAAGRPAP